MAENGVNLEFIGKQLEGLREDMKAMKEDLASFKETIGGRLDKIEKGQDRVRVRIALMETRDKDLAGDLATIARIIEAAGLPEYLAKTICDALARPNSSPAGREGRLAHRSFPAQVRAQRAPQQALLHADSRA